MDINDLSTFLHESVMVLLVLVQETEEFAHGKRLVRNLLMLILSHISFLEPNFCQLDGVYLVMDRIVDLRVLCYANLLLFSTRNLTGCVLLALSVIKLR